MTTMPDDKLTQMISDDELIKMLYTREKPRTKMIRNPYARRRSRQSAEKTPEQLRQIKLHTAAVERSRLKREAKNQKIRENIARVQEKRAERDAHRKAQQRERERLAMRDSFQVEDDEYDPYTDPEYLETLDI